MNVNIHHRNMDLYPTHSKLVDRHCKKIQRLLPTFPEDAVNLNVNLERLPRGSQYKVALTLSLPQKVIRVEEIEDNVTSSVVRAFEELRRRLQKFKSELNRERLWRRQPSTAPVGVVEVPAWEIENLAYSHMEKVENFIRREIFHQVITGTIPPGLLEPLALVDDVILQVTANPDQKPASLSIEQWLFQIARKTVRNRMEEVENDRDQPHVEETAHERVRWEDEDLHFYQPDESLQLEDLLTDGKSSNPEQLLERDEVAALLQRAVAKLPDSERESFVLFALEGFTSDEVAMITGKTPEQVLDQVENARQNLRKELQL